MAQRLLKKPAGSMCVKGAAYAQRRRRVRREGRQVWQRQVAGMMRLRREQASVKKSWQR